VTRTLKRVGHKGAALVAEGNTLDSFEAALRLGVDMIEFDVLRTRDGRLVLAHDPHDARSRDTITLDDGLDHFAGEAYAGVELDVDMKWTGFEREVVEGLRSRGLEQRALITSMYPESLDAVGELAPGLRRGWSVPRVKRDYTQKRWIVPAYALSRYLRARMPGWAREMLRAGRCEAVMAHWLVVSAALVRAVQEEGGELYVWTVDDARRIRRLERLGVDGVITNDPGLFQPARARTSDAPAG
jgi:glycerophosphoryl diester phosphodiesterase